MPAPVRTLLMCALLSQLAVHHEVWAYRVPRVGKDQSIRRPSHRSKGRSTSERHDWAVPSSRDTGGPIALDLLVVADPTTYGYHGDDTRHYVTEMMKVAAGLWRSPSLNVDVTLRVVDVKILTVPPDDLGLNHTNAMTLLRNFCLWQVSHFARLGESSSLTYDAAILVTRMDIQIRGNRLATGLAYNRGVCDRTTRCAVAEDETPMALAHTVAHELGHLLGMRHDADRNPCPDRVYVMSGFATRGPNTFVWSPCSGQSLLNFINSSPTACPPLRGLARVDAKKGVALDTEAMPGHQYDADYQCRMRFGPESSVCRDWNGSGRCSELKCMHGSGCKSYERPPMQGTSCGTLKWCDSGFCVQRGSSSAARGGSRGGPADRETAAACPACLTTFPYADTPAPVP